jgi:calpain-5
MVVKYLNQNYSKLKRDHQRRGELFTDPEFPPTNASLFISGKSEEEIVWKRPGVSSYKRLHGLL